jgi:hypothetical protein
MLKNLNFMQKTLNKHLEIIPDYDLKLIELPILNIERPTSPELIASTSEVLNLNTTVEKDWSDSSSYSKSSDSSDITV